ncbi:hypothetical protein Tco_0211982 [Tanacetum coccineum]
MGERTFFLVQQLSKRTDGIFISQDKYVAEILRKFDLESVKTATTPYEPRKPKDKNGPDDDVNVHLYRSMIGSLMYLTASRPDLIVAFITCSSFKSLLRLHLLLDYAGNHNDRKSTTGAFSFCRKRIDLWQCKKQTIVAYHSTEAEYGVCLHNCLWYAISHDPFIYDSLVKQFLRTASLRLAELGPPAIVATIDGAQYTISEASVRSAGEDQGERPAEPADQSPIPAPMPSPVNVPNPPIIAPTTTSPPRKGTNIPPSDHDQPSTSRLNEPDEEPLTSTFVEDETAGGSFHESPPRSHEATPSAGHLDHLPGSDKRMLSTAVKLWTRNLVIRQRVEDFQLDIESYQTQLNLTKPRWDATGYEFKHDYTIIESPRAVVFSVNNNERKIMRFNEIYKFSDGTLTRILEALDYRVKEFKVKRLNPGMNTRFWTQKDVTRSKEFIAAIEKRLKTKRIYQNLECFVGGHIMKDLQTQLQQLYNACYHDPEKCEHAGPKVTTSHGGITTTRMIKRFTVADDLKESSKITQANGQILHEEELDFLADLRIAEGQATQTVITHNAAYQAMLALLNSRSLFRNSNSSRITDCTDIICDLNTETQSVQIDHLKQTLSEHLKENESLIQTIILLKNDFKKEESRNIDRAIALRKRESKQGFQNPFYLKKAQQLEPKLYDGNVIKNTSAIVILDSEETLMLAGEIRSKMLLKQQDLMMFEKKVNTTPVDYAVLNQLSQDFEKQFVLQTELSAEQAFWSQNSMNSPEPTLSSRPTKVEVPKELPKVSMVIRVEKVLVITTLKDDLRKLKGKALVDNDVTKYPSDLEMLKIDVEPITPILLNKKTAHSAYIKHTQEEATVLKDLVKHVKSKYPLDQSLESACRKGVYKYWIYLGEPTGRTFTIVGNACPLTRITTTTEVPLRKPTALDNETSKPVVTLVYSRKPRKSKTNVPVSKSKVLKSVSANKKEPSQSWGSIVSDVPSSSLDECRSSKLFSVKFGNDHVAKILGYGDYQIGNVTISRVYYVEGLGHNLFSVGQFCDLNLEVAFR